MNKKKKETVLVVDDNSENLKVVGNILRENGYESIVAKKGSQALGSLDGEKPDLILLDIMMPEMDGYEVCRRLKADKTTVNIPVIFLTASVSVRDETKGFDLGAVDYITKPVSAPRLLARVKTHLALKDAREHLEKQNEILKENVSLREDVDRITRHDLKTPLNAIIGFPDAVKMAGQLNEEQIDMLEMIEESGYRMLDMINLSLDLYKMETGKYLFKPAPVDLLKLTDKIANEIKEQLEAGKLSIKIMVNGKAPCNEDTFLIQGDELLCHSMLGNLVKNAMEASPPGNQVEINMKYEDSAVISIHNKGTVPIEVRERFFEKYTTAGKHGGTGLGTYSARLIVEIQGGNISFETSEKTGTVVTILLSKAGMK